MGGESIGLHFFCFSEDGVSEFLFVLRSGGIPRLSDLRILERFCQIFGLLFTLSTILQCIVSTRIDGKFDFLGRLVVENFVRQKGLFIQFPGSNFFRLISSRIDRGNCF